jgi:hypothetical protein
VYLATGTHTGDLMGMPVADRHISIDVGYVADGQTQERWGGLNMYALLTRFGVKQPSPGSTRRRPSSTWHAGRSAPTT